MIQIRRHLLIRGQVQGVCFRYYTRRTALKEGVTGWVRNLPDGRVEVIVEGDEQAVAATIAWCRQGPEIAQVDQIDILEQDASGEFADFSIR